VNDPRASLRFVALALLSAGVLVAAIVAVNALVNPFGMYRAITVEGFNAHKPEVFQRVRLLKAYEVRRLGPRGIVLGTSRSHLGLRPSHEGWRADASPRYNLAFDGATTREMYHYLVHAHAVRPLRQVVLGLDTYHALPVPASSRPGFDLDVLKQPGTPTLGLLVRADLRLLASLDTLRASLRTIRAQAHAEPRWLAEDGQRLGEVFFRRPGETFVREGPLAYFEEVDRMEVAFQLEWTLPPHRPGAAAAPAPPPGPTETSLDYIARIVGFCQDNGIDLRIFLTPAHAHQMEIQAATGAWPAVEAGKRALAQLLAEARARRPDRPEVPLYDFSGYSSVTTEPLPGPGEEMRYYWESSHFKEVVGDYVLDRMFGVQRPERPVPPDFGVVLTAENLEAEMERVRRDQAAYRETHPTDVALIRRYVEDWYRQNGQEPRLAAVH
jgi:hypothetical protein